MIKRNIRRMTPLRGKRRLVMDMFLEQMHFYRADFKARLAKAGLQNKGYDTWVWREWKRR